MRRLIFLISAVLLLISSLAFAQADRKKEKLPPMSKETKACIGCHKTYTPGIVEDWMKSLHAKTAPSKALKSPTSKKGCQLKKFQQPLKILLSAAMNVTV